MGRVFVVDLRGRTYRCKFCKTLAHAHELMSRAVHCRRGRHTYLIMRKVNVIVGPHGERLMLSGLHTVADIFCCCCGQILCWKYEAAHEMSQKYKERKFVLERGRIMDGFDSELCIDSTASDVEDA